MDILKSWSLENVLDVMASPVALWNYDRSSGYMNRSAFELINLPHADTLIDSLFWMERVFSADRESLTQFWKEVKPGASAVSWDYRLLSEDAKKPLWIREFSVGLETLAEYHWAVISIYAKLVVSYPQVSSYPTLEAKWDRDLIHAFLHDLRNQIHKLTIELELNQQLLKENFDAGQFSITLDVLNGLEQNLRASVARSC